MAERSPTLAACRSSMAGTRRICQRWRGDAAEAVVAAFSEGVAARFSEMERAATPSVVARRAEEDRQTDPGV